MNFAQKLWRRGKDFFPLDGFHFNRPVVLFQSDDWGRVGVRDREGWDELCSRGLALGKMPYDFYTLETAEDLFALRTVLENHRDSTGRHPCVGMNFIVFNLDFRKMREENFQRIHLVPLAEGLPHGWSRPGLIEAYRSGISHGLFSPMLHGTTHFCRSAVERNLGDGGEDVELLKTLWNADTPYIHWRMPWIGYEYWDPKQPEDECFLEAELQKQFVGLAVGGFAKIFSMLPQSACAPGHRANHATHCAWAQHGIHVAQNGPTPPAPPHFDRHGLLHLSRTVEFEPATDEQFSVESCLRQAESCFERGIPAIVSLHSINFHSTIRDFRSQTIDALDKFLSNLESRHSDLLYLRDEDLYDLVNKGRYQSSGGIVAVDVTKKSFTRRTLATKLEA